MEDIVDMGNYIQSRKKKGKTPSEARDDLQKAGYDFHAATAMVMKYWPDEQEEEPP